MCNGAGHVTNRFAYGLGRSSCINLRTDVFKIYGYIYITFSYFCFQQVH